MDAQTQMRKVSVCKATKAETRAMIRGGVANEASGNELAAPPTRQTRRSGGVVEESTRLRGKQRVVVDKARRKRRV